MDLAAINTVCRKVGGMSRHGSPIYRVVVAKERKHLIGGYFADSGNHEYRWMPMYPNYNGFVLEKWLDASAFGSPRAWYDNREQDGFLPLGPYPKHGAYIPVERIRREALSPSFIEFLVRYQVQSIRLRRTKQEIKLGALAEEEEKRIKREAKLDKQLEDSGFGDRKDYLFTAGSAGFDSEMARHEEHIQRMLASPDYVRSQDPEGFWQLETIFTEGENLCR